MSSVYDRSGFPLPLPLSKAGNMKSVHVLNMKGGVGRRREQRSSFEKPLGLFGFLNPVERKGQDFELPLITFPFAKHPSGKSNAGQSARGGKADLQ